MPILVENNSVSCLNGVKDLIISYDVKIYKREDQDSVTTIQAKSITFYENMNGPQEDDDNLDLSCRGNVAVTLSFTDNESIDRMIETLNTLKDANIIEDEEE